MKQQMIKKDVCAWCRFFYDFGNDGMGTCRYHAPVVPIDKGTPPRDLEHERRNPYFPQMNRHEWCREFKRRK